MSFPFLSESFSINGQLAPKRCYLIGEIGINHNGSLEIAKQLINQCKAADFDAVKFQKRDIDLVYGSDFLSQPRESPWGNTQRDQKDALEFTLDQYEEISAHCKAVGIDWFASCWDLKSQEEMRRFSTPYNKVASAMATNIEFVQCVASEKKPTFLSTGMMTHDQIRAAVDIFASYCTPLVLMHTVSTYPAREQDLNLNCISSLRDTYGLPVGYSGHETSASPSVFAAVLGSVAIERHVTLDRSMYGSDQSASLELSGMLSLSGAVRKLSSCMGDGVKRILDEEMNVAEKLRYWIEPQKSK